MKAEIARRHADTDKVLALVRARDGQTLHWRRFFAIAPLAWRSRIANAREVFCHEQGLPYPIPKGGRDPLAWNGSITRSGYKYSSNPLGGRDASAYVPGNIETGSLFPDLHPGPFHR
jgi:hypothetical protein